MSVEKHGNKWRIRQSYNGERYTLTLDYKPSKKDADILMMEYILSESKKSALKGTFEYFANKYIDSKRNVLKSPTIVKYNSMVANIDTTFKNLQLKDITQEDVQILINEHSLTHKPKGTIDLHGFVAAVLKFYRPDFTLRTTLPKKTKSETYEPTDDDIKAILNYVNGGRYDIVFNLLVYGLRISEALAIDVKTDLIDRKENTTTLLINKSMVLDENKQYYIRESNKTSESTRKIEISNSLADKMVEKGYVFDGKPHMVNKALARYQDQLGIQRFNVHKLRHYYASMMLSLGIPITYVESSGGWKHGSTALRNSYTYAQDKKLQEQQSKGVEFLNNLFIGNE